MEQILTRSQKKVLRALILFINNNGYIPTIRELGIYLDLTSTATIHGHLQHLKEKGYIDYEKRKNRNLKILIDITKKSMTAKSMFEKLGYIQTENNDNFVEYEQEFNIIQPLMVRYKFYFCIEYECVECEILDNDNVHFVRLTSELNKAIAKQIKELKWEEGK